MFKAKAENEIRQEVIEDLRGDNEDFNEEDFNDQIDRITQRRLKDEQFKASVHKSKEEKKAKLAELEKKEAGSKEQKKEANATQETELSIKDSARLQQANIPVDDWDEVISYAKFKGVAITDALNSSVVRATLKERQEERTSAEAANAGASRRGSSKISGDKLLEKALKSGEIPETDAEMDALLEARYSRA